MKVLFWNFEIRLKFLCDDWCFGDEKNVLQEETSLKVVS